MYLSHPSSRLVYKAASGFWEKERERGREGAVCASLLRPQLQLGHWHSCCILLIKTSDEVSPDSRGEKTDPNSWWRELESQIAKVLVQRRVEDWGTTTPTFQGELLGPLPSPPLDPSAEPKLYLGLISDPAHLRPGSTWAVGPICWSQTLINAYFPWMIGPEVNTWPKRAYPLASSDLCLAGFLLTMSWATTILYWEFEIWAKRWCKSHQWVETERSWWGSRADSQREMQKRETM